MDRSTVGLSAHFSIGRATWKTAGGWVTEKMAKRRAPQTITKKETTTASYWAQSAFIAAVSVLDSIDVKSGIKWSVIDSVKLSQYLFAPYIPTTIALQQLYWCSSFYMMFKATSHSSHSKRVTYKPFLLSDIAASDQIVDMLTKAEEFWVKKQKDPTTLPPYLDEHCEDLNQDNNTIVKKLYVHYNKNVENAYKALNVIMQIIYKM